MPVLNTNGEKEKGKRMVLLGGGRQLILFCLYFRKCFWNRLKTNAVFIQILCKAHKDTQNAIVFIAFELCRKILGRNFSFQSKRQKKKSRWVNYHFVQKQPSWNIWVAQHITHFDVFILKIKKKISNILSDGFSSQLISIKVKSNSNQQVVMIQKCFFFRFFRHSNEVRIWRIDLHSKCTITRCRRNCWPIESKSL